MVICLEIYTGFVLVRYGKVIDTKTITFERRVCYLQFPEVSMFALMKGYMGKHQG